MIHPLSFLLRVGRADADRVALLGDLQEASRARIARGCGRLSTWFWLTGQITSAWVYGVWDAVRGHSSRGTQGLSRRGLLTRLGLVSWPDFKLSIRLLFKYPGLTLVASFGIAVGIAICAGFFAFAHSQLYPRLPLDEGDRIVALENWDFAKSDPDRHVLHDFVSWRDQMTTIVEMGAFRNVDARLQFDRRQAATVRLAAITASGFTLARVPPLQGRYLSADDERPGANPVLVVGYDAWRARFSEDPSIVGKQVRLGEVSHTIVGVMPDGFKFPVSHQFWVPLRVNPIAFERGSGPELFVFGRLIAGATFGSAQAELDTIRQRLAGAFPQPNQHVKPLVTKYTYSVTDGAQPGIELAVFALLLTISLVLVVVALNVAILVYARTASRRREIAVRTALGASRRRIVFQLFCEALVLALVPAIAGLALAQYGSSLGLQLEDLAEYGGSSPFWADYGLRPATIGYVFVLVIVTAGIVGVLPALQATRRSVADELRQLSGTALRLGRVWSVLIVAQVAIAVATLPGVVLSGLTDVRHAFTRPTYPIEEFLGFTVTTEGGKERLDHRLAELKRRFQAEPDVAAVTFAASLPGRDGARRRVELMGAAGAVMPAVVKGTVEAGNVRTYGIDTDYLNVYGLRILEGRSFDAGDAGDTSNPVIVDPSFVRAFLDGEHAVGRRFRYAGPSGTEEPSAWYEIVGVAESLSTNPIDPDVLPPFVFYPVAAAQVSAASLRVHVRGPAASRLESGFGQRVHRLTAAVDPALRLGDIRPSVVFDTRGALETRLIALTASLVVAAVLLLSAGGVYALMSFTVSQRRREIGIRTALGAPRHRVVQSIFARVALQIGIGVLLGVAGAVAIPVESATGWPVLPRLLPIGIPAIALFLVLVGFGAAVGPARRAVRIQPTEALKAE